MKGRIIGGGGTNRNFKTILYNGNGSTQSVAVGRNNAAGSLIWIKNRSSSSSHQLYDTVRGVTKPLRTNEQTAETTVSDGLTAFNSTGFTVGSSGSVNASGNQYVAWNFIEDSDFFDVVSWTGTGGTQNIACDINDIGMIIAKDRDATQSWQIYHKNLNRGTNPHLYSIGVTDGAENTNPYWGNTATAPDQFSVASVNSTSGNDFIGYVFADNVSKGIVCDGFISNTSGSATVTVGFQPQFLILRDAESSDAWRIIDTKRGVNKLLYPNLNIVDTSTASYTFTSNGFTATGLNASKNHIYLAIK